PAGTPAYMAPEQFFTPDAVDHRADIYSLGATLYHAVTGRVPFEGSSVREVLMKQAHEHLVPPHEIVPGLPRAVTELLNRMTAEGPGERFQNYEELTAAAAEVHTSTVLLSPAPLPAGPGGNGKAAGGSSRLLAKPAIAGGGTGTSAGTGASGAEAGPKNRS